MKYNIVNTSNFNPNYSHKFFFDSNVWLYLLFPQLSDISQRHINNYSEFFSKIKQKDCLIETNFVQMSELINVLLQNEFKSIKKINHSLKFKEFRNSKEGEKALDNAKILTSFVLKSATLRNGNFNSEELKTMVENCDKADINDIYFASHCLKEQAILVTHDFDFNALKSNLQIISANPKYL